MKSLQKNNGQLPAISKEEADLLKKEIKNIREDFQDNQYIEEAIRVLPVKGFRSAIGSYWNAVVDDLRNKVIHRSLDLFNKEMNKKVKTYEDFQDHVTDFDLIEGAFKIGVIGWEARKLLQQARETRNIFDGHPNSTQPNIIKVLNLISDCNRYVLSQEYPPSIIDITTYLNQMDEDDFERNEIAVEQAFADLPIVYKKELSNRMFSAYLDESTTTRLRSNIEFCAPILWGVLTKDDKNQIAKRFDKDVVEGKGKIIRRGTEYLMLVRAMKLASTTSRRVVFEPVIKKLEDSLDQWEEEAKLARRLERLGSSIPDVLLSRYVSALTLTFVGYKGSSYNFSRTDFYSDSAEPIIKKIFERFDDAAAAAFVNTIYTSDKLRQRIKSTEKLNRLRILGQILIDKGVSRPEIEEFLDLLVDKEQTGEFFDAIGKKPKKAKG